MHASWRSSWDGQAIFSKMELVSTIFCLAVASTHPSGHAVNLCAWHFSVKFQVGTQTNLMQLFDLLSIDLNSGKLALEIWSSDVVLFYLKTFPDHRCIRPPR